MLPQAQPPMEETSQDIADSLKDPFNYSFSTETAYIEYNASCKRTQLREGGYPLFAVKSLTVEDLDHLSLVQLEEKMLAMLFKPVER